MQHLLQCVRRVCVINYYQRLTATAEALHAANRPFQQRGDLENFIQRIVQRQQSTDGRQHVAQVETAEQSAAQGALTLGGDDHGAHAVVVKMRFAAIQRSGAVFEAVADQARLGLLSGQATTEVIVEINHPAAQVRPGEQARLGVFICLHAAVVIQMITRQVGHHCDIEFQGGNPTLIQGMGGDLHGDGFRPTLLQVIQGCLHRNRIRRGQPTALQFAIKAGTKRADQAAALTELVQCLGNQLRNAGLAVGASDPHQIQLTARFAIEAPGNVRELGNQALDRNQRCFRDWQHGGALRFISDCSRAALERVGNMVATIHLRTWHRQEQVTWANVTAVQSQLADQRIAAGLGEKFAQWHRHYPRPPLAGAASTCCCGVAGGRLSGGIFIRRNVPDMTLLKTGAETRPPK
ncbi:hypothetical protein D3C81_730730 [compost metagenome]